MIELENPDKDDKKDDKKEKGIGTKNQQRS
jgi:hypothetical protein